MEEEEEEKKKTKENKDNLLYSEHTGGYQQSRSEKSDFLTFSPVSSVTFVWEQWSGLYPTEVHLNSHFENGLLN